MLIKYNKDTVKKLENISSKILGITIISAVVIIISIFQFKPKINDKFISESSYPVQAATWIKENLNLEEIKLYNEYNYGSYLIYQGIPVFIDSRCDLYMPEFNDNTYVFKDFLSINSMNLTNVEAKLDDYGFTHFIVSRSSKLKMYLEENSDKYEKIYPNEEIKDDNFTIYERIDK